MGEHDENQVRNDLMRVEIDGLLEEFAQANDHLAKTQSDLASTTVTTWSTDNLVKVDSNAIGIPVDLHIEPTAFKHCTPDELARSVLEAMQTAARQADQAGQHAITPFQALAAGIPDLPDLIPGAPSVKDLFADTSVTSPAAPADATPELTEEDEDEYYRNRSYLNPDK
jgi:DNA-binding protein YbaB